jgi:hypothetical protein
MKTLFHFEAKEANGFLFLMPHSSSAGWLKRALHAFLEQYL